jgi:hypothetical protein
MRIMQYAVGALVLYSTSALAGVDECRSALVLSTYNRSESRFSDARLATYVTEGDYDRVNHGGALSAIIYGVPVGASYSDFQERAHQMAASMRQSLTQSEALNVMWSGIDPTSASAYSACLEAVVAQSRGIKLVVRGATDSDITLLLRYNPVGSDPNPMPLQWQPRVLAGAALPRTVTAGEFFIVVPRPPHQRSIAVNGGGLGDSVVLDRIPPHCIISCPRWPPPPTAFRVLPSDPLPACDSAGSPSPQRVPTTEGERANLALLREATASATSTIAGFPFRHSVANLIDGWYNNCRSWVAAQMPASVMVDLGSSHEVSSVAFGSEYQTFYHDRMASVFRISLSLDQSSWHTVYTSVPGDRVSGRREFAFSTQRARYVKIDIDNSEAGPVRIDELEIYGR